MPLSVCPNCETPMNEVSRRGVYVDVCGKCRGVWLDGGELEKLLATVEAPAPAEERRYRSAEEYRAEHRERYDDDTGARRRGERREGGGLFDIFEDLLG